MCVKLRGKLGKAEGHLQGKLREVEEMEAEVKARG